MTGSRGYKLITDALARNWGFILKNAQQTLDVTTQRGIRTVANPSISQGFQTNNLQLRYRRIGVDLFTDTIESPVISKRGKKYVQVYCTHFRCTRAYGILTKGTAHETLYNLLNQDGCPNAIIMDGSKEKIFGKFKKNANNADIHIRKIEPYSTLSNQAEQSIQELKKDSA